MIGSMGPPTSLCFWCRSVMAVANSGLSLCVVAMIQSRHVEKDEQHDSTTPSADGWKTPRSRPVAA